MKQLNIGLPSRNPIIINADGYSTWRDQHGKRALYVQRNGETFGEYHNYDYFTVIDIEEPANDAN